MRLPSEKPSVTQAFAPNHESASIQPNTVAFMMGLFRVTKDSALTNIR